MPDAVDDFDNGPEPHQGDRDRPAAAHGPEKAPRTEGEERQVEDDESALQVGRYEPGDEPGRRERFPEMSDVLFDRMGRLDEDQRGESKLNARHERSAAAISARTCAGRPAAR